MRRELRELDDTVVRFRLDPAQGLPDALEDGADRLVPQEHEIDVVRVPRGWGKNDLVERSPTAEGGLLLDQGIVVEIDDGSADDEVLLHVGVIGPRGVLTPRSDHCCGDHLFDLEGAVEDEMPTLVSRGTG